MNIKNKKQWENAFLEACEEGNFNEVRKLCDKSYVECGWADIHHWHECGFRMACWKGHLEVVRYLLTSPELKDAGHSFANLHAGHEYGFRVACISGNLDIVKYLLTSPDLKGAGHSFADVHALNEEGFKLVCGCENWNIVRWLVIDYGIEKNPIEKIIKDYPQVQEYFRSREELEDLRKVMEVKEGEGEPAVNPVKKERLKL